MEMELCLLLFDKSSIAVDLIVVLASHMDFDRK